MDSELSSVSSLLKTDKCSPLIVYIVLVIISAVTIFNTNGSLKKFKNFKVDNIFTMYMWHEVSLLLILGVVLFGLCQYNQQTLAWIVLFLPLSLQIFKALLVFNSVHMIQKLAPPDAPVTIPGSPSLPTVPGVPDPSVGPTPPQLQRTSPTGLQTDGVRQAISERRDQITGMSDMAPPLGGSPF